MPHEASLLLIMAQLAVEGAFVLFVPGWLGVERVFFQRQFDRKPVPLSHLLRLVPEFLGRFLALGVPFGIVTFTFVIAIGRLVGFAKIEASVAASTVPLSFMLPLVTYFFTMDFLLTFIPPALAYTTRSVTKAAGIGRGMIRQTWPRSALYLLCPPLALNILHNIFPTGGVVVRIAVTCVVVPVGLVAKGAIAAFYLRERGSYSEDGAAYIAAGEEALGDVAVTTPIHHG